MKTAEKILSRATGFSDADNEIISLPKNDICKAMKEYAMQFIARPSDCEYCKNKEVSELAEPCVSCYCCNEFELP